MRVTYLSSWTWRIVCGLLCVFAIGVQAQTPIDGAMDAVVGRMTKALSAEQLQQVDEAGLAPFITPEDRTVFATEYWRFEVNVPVVVSVMREAGQKAVPFWLSSSGFVKTALEVRNEEYQYEVWQKAFPAGRIGLGIPGFEKYRPNYFVSVAPRDAGAKLELSHFYPADQVVFTFEKGAYTYHDWPDLVLTVVPDALRGQALLPTYRGRARESHLIGAFRDTEFPSSAKPDQVLLTWADDPRTSQAIQWRTNVTIDRGTVQFRVKGGTEAAWQTVEARVERLEDRLILNDRVIHRYTAKLSGLTPGTEYEYSVGGEGENQRSAVASFRTAPAEPEPFTFVFLSDTHNGPATRDLLMGAQARYPETAFMTISGDLVGTGQYRDNWDALFERGRGYFEQTPFMPCMGNHDAIDGLGSGLYRAELELPANGPAGVPSEAAYSFRYGNALFIMPDVTESVEAQTPWIEGLLRDPEADWTFVILHFPPYAPDSDEPAIVEQWVPLFDRYHADFVLAGHVHHYQRTFPMKGGKPVESLAEGTVYFITVSVMGGPEPVRAPSYAAKFDASGKPLFVAFTVDGKRVSARAETAEGTVLDEMVYDKVSTGK